MATATIAQPKGRRSTRARGVRIFKWSVLSPLILLFAVPDAGISPADIFFVPFLDGLSLHLVRRGICRAGVVSGGVDRRSVSGMPWGARCCSRASRRWAASFAASRLALLMYRPFRGQAFFYILFILPMLTVPVVIAYTADMLLYEKGPINGFLSYFLPGDLSKFTWLANPEFRHFYDHSAGECGTGRLSSSSSCWRACPRCRPNPWRPPAFWGRTDCRFSARYSFRSCAPSYSWRSSCVFWRRWRNSPKRGASSREGRAPPPRRYPSISISRPGCRSIYRRARRCPTSSWFIMIFIVLTAIYVLRREKRALDALHETSRTEA